MTFGIVLALIVLLGYGSNYLNGRYLNYAPTRMLYYIGAFVHETSHAVLCVLTGAHIEEFAVFSTQPHVLHTKSRIPLIGGALISAAPVFGGLAFLWLIDKFVLGGAVLLTAPSATWQSMLLTPLHAILGLNLRLWQSWVFLLLLINCGAMIGPSMQDIKNAWIVFALLLLVRVPYLTQLALIALMLIIANIMIQLVLIAGIKIVKLVTGSSS